MIRSITIFLGLLLVSTAAMAQTQDSVVTARKARSLVRDGNRLFNTDQYNEASVSYKKSLEKNPYNAKASYNLGGALYKEKNYEEAASAYQNAAKMAQTPIGASQSFHNLGNTYMQSKQYDQAIESYKNALRLNPADEETRDNLAVAKQKKKEQEKEQQGNQNKDKKDQQDQQNQQNDQGQQGKNDQKDPNKEGKQDPNKKQDQNKQQAPPPKLTPEQMKQMLENLSNEEKKTQEKMKLQKAKGRKKDKEKDW